jgi:SAM-dependent methyltransferase
VLGGIPWLFAEPNAAIGDWRARFGRSVREHEEELRAATRALGNVAIGSPAHTRLTHWANAQRAQPELLGSLLRPMLDPAGNAALETYLALRTRLPPDQGLVTYAANLHRDWAWGDEENDASLRAVQEALGDRRPSTMLVVGAGGCRLAYDLHAAFDCERTVALDINPLLLYTAARVCDGADVDLWEFPLAPRAPLDGAVLRTLRAPAPARDGLHLVLADGRRAPFRAGTFDTVVAPWYLDIVQEGVASSVQRINRLLAPGGVWITFGSLTFGHGDPADRWSVDEVAECVLANGFTRPHVVEHEMPYLCSPASRHGRRERVLTLRADKSGDCAQPTATNALPDWIVRGTTPIPLTNAFQRQIATTRIHAYIMSLIDGRRSLADIARVLEQQRLLSRIEAEAALRAFLTTMHDESARNRGL